MTQCIICGAEHSRLFNHTLPHRYCLDCEELKRAANSVATHVIGSIYLGDMVAGNNWPHQDHRLSVYDSKAQGSYHHIPILVNPPNSAIDRTGARASLEQIEKACALIEEAYRIPFHPFIVHCMGGVERSPLVMAHFLVRIKHSASLADAYAYLKSIRPVVSDRTFWLP